MRNIVEETTKDLMNLADFDRKKYGKKSYPTCMKIIGVKVPDQRNVVKKLSKEINNLPKENILKIALGLIKTNISECQQVAYEVIANNKTIMSELTLKDIQKLNKNLDNWLSVDCFGCLIVGPIWKGKRIPDSFIINLAKSKDLWMRRAAVVATVALNQKARGGSGDPKRTLEICSIVVEEKEDMVIKSLSWALRELAKRDVKSVKAFIMKYENVLHAKVKREVYKKIETGKK